jgi:diaminopimelate epimerase
MRIPFVKAHGAGNDFLLTPAADAPDGLAEAAVALCDRHRGIGADGWLLIGAAPPGSSADAAIRLFNSDGSEAEISGNGTRCAAAWLVERGASGGELRILTGAGEKNLRLLARDGLRYEFEANMGRPVWNPGEIPSRVSAAGATWEGVALDVGNPQFAIAVDRFPDGWQAIGAEIERNPRFPRHTNVSFFRRLDDNSIEARFWERGAGETLSSGTGSTGAAVAAILRGLVQSPVRVVSASGEQVVRWEGDAFLTGPAEIAAGGEFYWRRDGNRSR